ncbi:hypothetical protein ABPG74_008526 [Tetrahymena malaccensis]
MSKKAISGGNKLIAVIGDSDTVTGFLLTGIGDRNLKGQSNFLVVQPGKKFIVQNKHEIILIIIKYIQLDTKEKLVEDTFNGFLKNGDIAVILVSQHVAEKYLRSIINSYEETLPAILEIPSKDKPYEPKKDIIMQRANKLLYGSEIV